MQPHIRAFVDRVITFQDCPECGGTRLNEIARSSLIEGRSIADACAMQVSDLAEWVRGLTAPGLEPLLENLQQTLDAFVQIGLGYLSLDRPSGTLSGGEAQRTKMIRHLSSALTDVTYIFDEPTIGLHQTALPLAERKGRTPQPDSGHGMGLPAGLYSNDQRTTALAPWLEHYSNGRRHSEPGGHPPTSRLSPT